MRRMSAVIGMLFAAWAAAGNPADGATCGFEQFTADIDCGSRTAWTQMARLPATRIVVYDPMSNSFAFVSPCAQQVDRRTSATMDRLDVQRLALPTQKIRLLIMPHDPLFEDLQLEVKHGTGVEFDPSPFSYQAGERLVPLTTAKTTETDDETQASKGEDEEDAETEPVVAVANPSAPKVSEPQLPPAATMSTETRSVLDALRQRGWTGLDETQRRAVQEELPALGIDWARFAVDQALSSVQRMLNEVAARHDENSTLKSCIKDLVGAMPMQASAALNEQARPLPVTRDLTAEEVATEACRRTRAIKAVSYKSTCFKERGEPFQVDLGALRRLIADERSALSRLKGIIGIARQSMVVLESKIASAPANRVPALKLELAGFKAMLTSVEADQASLAKQLEGMMDSPDELIATHKKIVSALYSPAVHLQRFNFNPLANGEALTFNIWRGEQKTGDGDRVAIPARKNSLTLKSAPAVVLRFGAGLVASQLEDPTFETITIPGVADSNPNDNEDDSVPAIKQIAFDDENDQRVFPGVFVHHYWGRRSPLLAPTMFERLIPTFSLGVPLTDAELFKHVLLGMDWEIVPGFELNLGAHFGKRQELAKGWKVGQTIPDTLDLTELVQTGTDWSLYWGVVLNASSFDTLLRRDQQQ